jgi:hypothetical protein
MRALFIRNVILSVLFLLAILALETSHLSAPARAADATLAIDNSTFEPQRLTVKAGTTITWVDQDDRGRYIPHPPSGPIDYQHKARLDAGLCVIVELPNDTGCRELSHSFAQLQ